MMARRRARIEELSKGKFESIAPDYSRKMCFDEECRRIRVRLP